MQPRTYEDTTKWLRAFVVGSDAQYSSQPYYGEVAASDAALAPLLDEVRALAQPTLVILTGDHGEALGDHGEQTHGLFAYESTLRIPLILAEVGGMHAATRGTRRGHPLWRVMSTSCRRFSMGPRSLRARNCRGDRF